MAHTPAGGFCAIFCLFSVLKVAGRVCSVADCGQQIPGGPEGTQESSPQEWSEERGRHPDYGEMDTLRVVLSTFGEGVCVATLLCSITQGNELIPTSFRATGLGIIAICGNFGAALSPLMMILRTYSEPLPWIVYGILSIVAGLSVLLLPETRNQPLPDYIQDVKNKARASGKAEQEDTLDKVTRF